MGIPHIAMPQYYRINHDCGELEFYIRTDYDQLPITKIAINGNCKSKFFEISQPIISPKKPGPSSGSDDDRYNDSSAWSCLHVVNLNDQS